MPHCLLLAVARLGAADRPFAALVLPLTKGERREIRVPFSAFAGGDAPLDLSRLRSVSMRLSGEPGGRAWLALAKVRFYR